MDKTTYDFVFSNFLNRKELEEISKKYEEICKRSKKLGEKLSFLLEEAKK